MSELYHFGIVGMKWGVRRFQNPDGTLTEAGKRRYSKAISDGSGSYLNPKREERKKGKTNARDAVAQKYVDDWDKAVKDGMPENEPSEKGREIWDKYKDAYAEATLKDLDIPITQETKAMVKEILERNDPHYNYDSTAKKEVKETDRSNADTDKPKIVSELSDQELQRLVNRKQMEQNYERLTNPPSNNQNQQNNQNNQQERKIDSSEIRGKSISEMTDKELQVFLNRIDMEQKVKNAFRGSEKTGMETAKKVVSGAIAAGVTVTTALATYGKLKAYIGWLNNGEYENFAGGQKKKQNKG